MFSFTIRHKPLTTLSSMKTRKSCFPHNHIRNRLFIPITQRTHQCRRKLPSLVRRQHTLSRLLFCYALAELWFPLPQNTSNISRLLRVVPYIYWHGHWRRLWSFRSRFCNRWYDGYMLAAAFTSCEHRQTYANQPSITGPALTPPPPHIGR